MRELTHAELELISGGYDSSEDIVVTGSPYHPPYYPPYGGYPPPGYYPPSYPPPYGGGGGGGGEVVPEIVVTGHQPPVTQLGDSGWSAQFYSDGIAVLRYMNGAPQEWNFTMDYGPNTTTATATVPPSISATNTGMTYHFTGLHQPNGTVHN